jgi:hypothetical protein
MHGWEVFKTLDIFIDTGSAQRNNIFTAGGTLTCLCSEKNISQACFCESSGLGGDCDSWS